MRSCLILLVILLCVGQQAQAARPLSCDDAGTVEKGGFELESDLEYVNTTDDEYNWTTALKYGIADNLDIGMELPYQFLRLDEGEGVDGFTDITFSAKYNFFKPEDGLPQLALSFAWKTKTGNQDKSLGSGESDYSLNAILSQEWEKVVAHLNLGYTYQGASEGERDQDLCVFGLAAEFPWTEELNLVAELSGETDFEGRPDEHPLAVLAGFNYALSEALTVDFGVSSGISDASPEYTIISGFTVGF